MKSKNLETISILNRGQQTNQIKEAFEKTMETFSTYKNYFKGSSI